MKSFVKKNKFRIIAIVTFLVLIFSLTSRVFGAKYESLDFSIRESYCKLLKCKVWSRD